MTLSNIKTPEQRQKRLAILEFIQRTQRFTTYEIVERLGLDYSTTRNTVDSLLLTEAVKVFQRVKKVHTFDVVKPEKIAEFIQQIKDLIADPFAVTPIRREIGAFARSVESFTLTEIRAVLGRDVKAAISDLVAHGLLFRNTMERIASVRWSIHPFPESARTVAPMGARKQASGLQVKGMSYEDYKDSLGLSQLSSNDSCYE